MNKIVLLILIAFLFSCKKKHNNEEISEKTVEPNTGKYKFKINHLKGNSFYPARQFDDTLIVFLNGKNLNISKSDTVVEFYVNPKDSLYVKFYPGYNMIKTVYVWLDTIVLKKFTCICTNVFTKKLD